MYFQLFLRINWLKREIISLSSCWFPICHFWCSWNVSLIYKPKISFTQLFNLHLMIISSGQRPTRWVINESMWLCYNHEFIMITISWFAQYFSEYLRHEVLTSYHIWLDNITCSLTAKTWRTKSFGLIISVLFFSWINSSKGSYHKGIYEEWDKHQLRLHQNDLLQTNIEMKLTVWFK